MVMLLWYLLYVFASNCECALDAGAKKSPIDANKQSSFRWSPVRRINLSMYCTKSIGKKANNIFVQHQHQRHQDQQQQQQPYQ